MRWRSCAPLSLSINSRGCKQEVKESIKERRPMDRHPWAFSSSCLQKFGHTTAAGCSSNWFQFRPWRFFHDPLW